MYPVDVQNPMYYRSHPYKNQFDLPIGAFKNRQLQQFYSEIPQGRQYFELTNKKHFSNIFNRSEIEQDQVFKQKYPQQEIQKSRIVMDKSYFRSLNVEDIEGAKPNTLISKAVKNREKAIIMMKKQQQSPMNLSGVNSPYPSRQSNLPNSQHNYHMPLRQQKIYKQEEAMNKFGRNKSILENNSLRILNNQNNYDHISQNDQSVNDAPTKQFTVQKNNQLRIEPKSNYHFRPSKQGHSSPINGQIEKIFQSELMEKEKRIRLLQKQLNIQNQVSYQNSNNLEKTKPYQQASNPYSLQFPSIKSDHSAKLVNNEISRLYPSNQYHPQHQQQNNPQNYKQNSFESKQQKPYLQQNFNYPNHQPQILNTMPPSTHVPQSRPQKNRIGLDLPIASISHNREKSYTEKSDTILTNIDKRNIRKYNPTYLSFQSDRFAGTIGMAGQSLLL